MQAFEIQPGFGFDNLKLVQRPMPQCGPGHVLLKMLAAGSVNAQDTTAFSIGEALAHGRFSLELRPRYNRITESDYAERSEGFFEDDAAEDVLGHVAVAGHEFDRDAAAEMRHLLGDEQGHRQAAVTESV